MFGRLVQDMSKDRDIFTSRIEDYLTVKLMGLPPLELSETTRSATQQHIS